MHMKESLLKKNSLPQTQVTGNFIETKISLQENQIKKNEI